MAESALVATIVQGLALALRAAGEAGLAAEVARYGEQLGRAVLEVIAVLRRGEDPLPLLRIQRVDTLDIDARIEAEDRARHGEVPLSWASDEQPTVPTRPPRSGL